MAMFHPIYGELMTAKEVSLATGHTLNQLRNWRMDSRAHLAPFGSIQIGATSYYRQVVVQDWLDENGQQNGTYKMTDRDKKFPLNVAVEGDIKHREAIRMLSAIVPENVLSVFGRLAKQSSKIAMSHANGSKNRFILEEFPEWKQYEDPITQDHRFARPVWFTAMVKAMRLAQNEIAGLGFSEEEVLALPVGDVPPVREVKG